LIFCDLIEFASYKGIDYMKIFHVDVFSNVLFKGNPAAVCILSAWLPDKVMQQVTRENALADTAFLVAGDDRYYIRWFSPKTELDLCGHATLASAHVLFSHMNHPGDLVTFESRKGPVQVLKTNNHYLQLDLPAQQTLPAKISAKIINGLGQSPVEVVQGEDLIAIFESESDIINLKPDFTMLGRISMRGICATAPGDNSDFVCRFFAPRLGINEDSVTGSLYCELTPYWANRLKRTVLSAVQLSERGGELVCELRDDRVLINGRAITYMIGEIPGIDS
jgi:PhzF family phenazine biosynthesis protein